MKAADGSAALGRLKPVADVLGKTKLELSNNELLGPLEKEKEFPAPKGLGGERCLLPLGAKDANDPNEDVVPSDDAGTASGTCVASAK